jgi:AAA+ superfamily predicted ATPase
MPTKTSGVRKTVRSGSTKKKVDPLESHKRKRSWGRGRNAFQVTRKKVKGVFGPQEICLITITGDDLQYALRDISNDDLFYRHNPTTQPTLFIPMMEDMKNYDEENGNGLFEVLLKFLEVELEGILYECRELEKDDNITFETLWYLFKKGDDVSAHDNGELVGGRIVETNYKSSWFSKYFELKVEQVHTDGVNFFPKLVELKIGEFDGVKKISSLPVHPMTDKEKKTLTARGKVFEKFGLGAKYVENSGNMYYRNWWGTSQFKADGRTMIDMINFGKRNANYGSSLYSDDDEVAQDNAFTKIPKDMIHLTSAFLKGFSFKIKKWGEFAVSQLSDIVFNDGAFETLVLDQNKKDLISSLVRNTSTSFKDIIAGKSGGCIFLLHGPPGTGKTLTAEAISESLHRPLYSVSVGELGVEPNELEKALREVLDMASVWNAVILIDEADIFLEERGENDILRNAMVGIFLRLLEYHQGILFLTTNRVNCFDEAFHSRISIALHYAAHGSASRKKIWNNLLESAGLNVDKFNLTTLARYDINGRQIKNTIRLSQALAAEGNREVTMEDIKMTIGIQEDFVKKTDSHTKKQQKSRRG